MATNVMGGIEFSAGNAVGQKYSVKSGRDNNPVSFVSWYDAIRMANWMHNRQGSGDTEDGAYTLGALGPGAVPINGPSITRNAGAHWFLPSDHEWYKAAYHHPFAQGGDGDDYWEYPTRSNQIPFSAPPPGTAAPQTSNTTNYFYNDLGPIGYNDGYAVTGSHVFDPMQNYLTDVGAYSEANSYYGTFDQAGSQYEWNERPYAGGVNRELRGGSWAATGFFDPQFLAAPSANGLNPATGSFSGVGFRLATIVPEPSGATLVASVASLSLVHCRNRARTRRSLPRI
jgi:formylglycine-generating enzyme required for sulfatase activity